MKYKGHIPTVLLSIFFIAFIVFYENYSYQNAHKRLQEYGQFLRHPLYEVDSENTLEYAKLISNFEGYRQIIIKHDNGTKFIEYLNPEKMSQSFSLFSKTVPFSIKLSKYNRHIGTAEVLWQSQNTYIYINVFLIFIFLLVIWYFYIYSEARKRNEELIKKSEANYRKLVATIPIGIQEISTEGKVNFINPAICEIFQCNRNDVIVKSIFNFLTSEEEKLSLKNHMQQLIEYQPTPFPFFSSYELPSGERRHIQIDWSYRRDEEGRLIGFTNALTDITDKKLAVEKLQEAKNIAEKANMAKSEFLANISHELRTPMHGIISFSKFGIRKINQSDKEKILSYFQNIYDSAARLMYLLNDLLDLSKLESGKMQYNIEQYNVLPIFDIILSEQNAVSKKKNINIVVNEPHISTVAYIDHHRIAQVIRNLVSNAIKFSYPDKNIIVSFEDSIIKHDSKSIEALKIKIKDYGVGIPENEIESVFNKFIQSSKTKTGAGGTGLGLAICKEIVDHHKGGIWVENNKDEQGTTFIIELPKENIFLDDISDTHTVKSIVE